MLFLGLDCSTQSLSALLMDLDKSCIVWEKSILFEKQLPHYNTTGGTLVHPSSLVVHSPPLMWLEALDLLFEEMTRSGKNLKQIAAVAGSAQQHGSVYFNRNYPSALSQIDPQKTLKENFKDVFSRKSSPIWMDSSTHLECDEIREKIGKRQVIEKTGSDLFERFTAPQIRKFFKQEKAHYDATQSIALVSSFLASILSGKIAPIDYADGSGMGLMDLVQKKWDEELMEAAAPRLREKLPPLAPSTRIIGPIAPYFCQKYGLSSECLSLVWTGDNPSSLVGLGLAAEGDAAASLGTSFTYFGISRAKKVDLSGEGLLFANPMDGYMPMNCFLNGAFAIDALKKEYGWNWDNLSEALRSTPPGNRGGIMLPYFLPEIVPKVLTAKVHRLHLKPEEKSENCRALIEAQMMSMKIHSRWMGLSPQCIRATGGISHHRDILQIMADIHNCLVIQSPIAKSTALGAAIIAAYAFLSQLGKKATWSEIATQITQSTSAPILPNPATIKVYEELMIKYAEYESQMQKTL